MADEDQVQAPPQTATPPPPAAPPASPDDYQPDMINPAMAIDSSQLSNTPLNMLTPAHAAEPVPPQPLVLPPDDPHLSLMHRILDKVGSILGGDTTYRLTKAADGSMSIAPDVSTMGEKWGRVAAAALGGLASALPQSFGPAGVAGGAAAGFQAGVQQPIQQRQNQQQAVDFQNQQLLARANRIHLAQQTYMLSQQARLAGYMATEEAGNIWKSYATTLANSPNAEDLGTVDPSDPNSAMRLLQNNSTAYDAFLGKNTKMLRYVPTPNGKLQLFLTDRNYEEMKNTVPVDIPVNTLDSNGKPTQKIVGTVQPGQALQKDLNDYIAGATAKHLANLKTWAEAQKAEADANKPASMTTHLTTTPGATAALITQKQQALAAETDPAKRQQLQGDIDSLTSLHAQQLRDVQAGRPVSYQPYQTTEGQLGFVNPRNPAAPPIVNPQIAGRPGPAQAAWPTTGPAAAYAPGTPGIAPKQIGKIPADTAKAARLGRSAIGNAQEAIRILQQHPDLVGRLNSLGSGWQQAVGVSGDDPLTQLQAAVEQSTQASLGAHSFRSTRYVQEKEQEVTNHLRNDPSSIIAYLNERIRSNQQFDNEEKNYLSFGTPTGPQGPPTNQQQQQQPAATKGTRSIAAVRQALPQFRNSTDDEIRNALQQQHYNVVP